VGHSCFSHVSEAVYGASGEFKKLIIYINETFGVTPKPHEIMSWLVVRSQRFKEFMQELKQKKILGDWVRIPENIDDIAGNIIGYRQDPKDKYLADIINGPMDADKLEYLVRDAYFAGPTVVYDLDRFLHTVDAIEYPCDPPLGAEAAKVTRMSIPIEGVTALEQIIISKLMLFSYLYHHHKIRCVEGMYHEVLKRLTHLSNEGQKGKNWPKLDHPTCFLSLSDRSLLPAAWPPEIQGDKIAGEIVAMLTRRRLYKRALVISRLFIPGIDNNDPTKSGFERLLFCGSSETDREALRDQIFEKAHKAMTSKPHKEQARDLAKSFKPHHVLLDIPRSPTVEETQAVMIRVSREGMSADAKYVPLTDIFPIEKWVDAYNAIKWRGHVFTIEEAAPFVNEAALDVLQQAPYHLTFSPEATELCKLPDRQGGSLGLFQ